MLQRRTKGLALLPPALKPQRAHLMAHALSDEEAGLQILGIFVRNKVQASGMLRRIHFFDVRDGDFQRGINHAVASRWITVHHRDRYRYILTEMGYAAGRQTGVPSSTPIMSAAHI